MSSFLQHHDVISHDAFTDSHFRITSIIVVLFLLRRKSLPLGGEPHQLHSLCDILHLLYKPEGSLHYAKDHTKAIRENSDASP
jgi:hypothetical protein